MTIKFVFVQLGSFIPNYLEGNIKRLSSLFPNNEIYLITNNQKLLKLTIPNLRTEIYNSNDYHEYLLNRLSKKSDFREGFWRLSLERLLALTKFQTENKTEFLLHLESDVILFPNFPLDSIKKLNKLSWSRYNDKLDIASLLYSPNNLSASLLQEGIEHSLELNNHHTDMTILNEIRRTNDSAVTIFPSLPYQESYLMNQKSGISINSQIQISSEFSFFGGIFDPAAIGVWLLGKNPENSYARLILHDRWIIDTGDSFIDPSGVNYTFKPDGNLYLVEKENHIPIFNLHVHSKNFDLLNAKWVKELDRFVKLSDNKNTIKYINLTGFAKLLALNFKRKKLIEFILSFPLLYSLRMKVREIFSKT